METNSKGNQILLLIQDLDSLDIGGILIHPSPLI